MSRSVDLFIQYRDPIDELAALVGRVVDRPLVPGPAPESWVLRDGGAEALLRVHPYLDDADLPFSGYRYALSASVPNDVRVQDAPVTELLRRVADRLQRGEGLSVLLALDLQYRDRPTDTASPTPSASLTPSASPTPSAPPASPRPEPVAVLDGAAE